MYELLKRLLFLLPPERAHYTTLNLLRVALKLPLIKNILSVQAQSGSGHTIMGLAFPNRLGMAAGFDKNAEWLYELKSLGFGFVEIGTVTPRPQSGNPSPRLFRIPRDRALINRMGFNNQGAGEVASNLKKYRERFGQNLIIGGNIGKNKDTPNEDAASDYVRVYEVLYPYVDYFVINVSSPNTPNLRALQERSALEGIIAALQKREQELLSSGQRGPKPLLLKIAPDLSDEAIDELTDMATSTGLTGIVATNTTIERNLSISKREIEEIGAGGCSGAPVKNRATEVIKRIADRNPDLVLIGVGGIGNVPDGREKLDAGADLLQVYTGFIYGGPALIKQLIRL